MFKKSLGTIIKNLEMLRSVPNHLKTKKNCGNAAKNCYSL